MHARQERVCDPPLSTVLKILQLNRFGKIIPGIVAEWVPLWELDEAGRAAVRKTDADTDAVMIGQGIIDADDARLRVANARDSLYPGLSGPAPGPPKLPGGAEGLEDDPTESIEKRGVEGSTSGANSGDAAPDFVEGEHPRAPDGKWTDAAGAVKIKPTKERAFSGRAVATHASLSKLETGAVGEAVVISYLKSKGFQDAKPLNTRATNFPVDLVGDHHLIEVKTGLVSNGPSAQQWRATIGQPGKAEALWLKTASAEEKSKWNAAKKQAIMDRKLEVLRQFQAESDHAIVPKTITTIINPDTRTVDVYEFDGFHHRIAWNSAEAQKAYVGSFKVS
jgi:hypothetical protein